ncbi:MAG: FHA domain-containing protein [Anaerolineales bacterium]
MLDNCLIARAQGPTAGQAILYPADASSFPTISSLMDVFDASGRFVSGLKADQVTVVEDGQPLRPAQLMEMTVPLQLTAAVNPGPSLGDRERPNSPQVFQGAVDALSAWAKALPADTPDDMSLVSISGPVIAHASAKDWLVSLGAFQPIFEDTTPNLQSLQVAIDTVSVPPPRPGMKRAVLFLTPHMDDFDIEAQVQPLIEHARQNGVRIFVWFIDTELYTATASASAFNTLASQTGGAFFAANGGAPYPDPESYFAPLRRVYSIQYDSQVKTPGSHNFSVQVSSPNGSILSEDQPFTVDLQPPNPIFVSPQLEIVRSPPENDPYNSKVLQPTEQRVDILVEFPDGHKRALARTTLYVDGQVAAENTSEPFDSFTWDLSGYTSSGEHKLSVEALDEFNLNKTSIEIPVTVTVVQPPHGPAALFARYRQYITWAAVALAGLLLVLILVLGRRPSIFARRAARTAPIDPVTQAVEDTGATRPMHGRTTKRRRAVTRRTTPPSGEAGAYLRPLQPDPLAAPGQTFKPAPGQPIPLAADDTTFGTDPTQASYVLEDPSLDAQHARITRNPRGEYFVADAGTIGGTWVNFEPIGQTAHLLKHGDVIHFGQLVFRFELKEPPAPVPPKISKPPPSS